MLSHHHCDYVISVKATFSQSAQVVLFVSVVRLLTTFFIAVLFTYIPFTRFTENIFSRKAFAVHPIGPWDILSGSFAASCSFDFPTDYLLVIVSIVLTNMLNDSLG